MVTRTPTPGTAAAPHRRRSLYSPRTAACSGEGEPQEVGVRRHDGRGRARPWHRAVACARAITSSTRARISSSAASDADAATCASAFTSNGTRTLRNASITLRVRDRVPDAQRGEPVRLRERAQHRDVVMPARADSRPSAKSARSRTRGTPRRTRPGRSSGTRSRKRSTVSRSTRRAGRVVRVAHEHEPRAVGDGVDHRVEVVAVRRGERHLHHGRAHLHARGSGTPRTTANRTPPRHPGRRWRRAPCGRARPNRCRAAPARVDAVAARPALARAATRASSG